MRNQRPFNKRNNYSKKNNNSFRSKNKPNSYKKPNLTFFEKIVDTLKALKYLPCPRCKLHDNHLVSKQALHQCYKEKPFDKFDSHENRMRTHTKQIAMARFRITRKCNKCGYKWTFEKEGEM